VNVILIDNAHCICVERNGVLEVETDLSYWENDQLLEIIKRIVSLVGGEWLDGPVESIRRFGKRPLRITQQLQSPGVHQ
jgi:Flp pilus assembly CpaF family ATPase